MKDKKTLNEILIITGLVIALGVLWFLIVNTNNNAQNSAPNANNPHEQTTAIYAAVKKFTTNENLDSETLVSTSSNENVVSANGNIAATLTNMTINKTGDSNGGDNTSFYGTNSAIIAKNGATLTIKGGAVTTNATGANGVFSYGGAATTNNATSDGTTINITDATITTHKDNSGGIMATGGGIINAENLTIKTAGISSAAIRSDRGGGVINVDKGIYETTGKGSPTIYSTANITVKNAKLISHASEGVVVEGKNSVTLENVELNDTNNILNGQSTTYKNIFLYQSMSGDAADGEAVFSAKNSVITTNQGDSFYVTNTTAIINLENNEIINNDATGNFLHIQKAAWGNNGKNGGVVTLNLKSQAATGNIVVDEISKLTINLQNGSSFEGMINNENAGEVALIVDEVSTIILTGDTYVKSFTNTDTTNSNIDLNGYTLYINGTAYTELDSDI